MCGNLRQELDDCGVDIPKEFEDYLRVLLLGARKYKANNWLEPNGKSADHKSMHESMFRHLADSQCGNRQDHESGLDPLLHLAARALMYYTRSNRGIRHEADVNEESK